MELPVSSTITRNTREKEYFSTGSIRAFAAGQRSKHETEAVEERHETRSCGRDCASNTRDDSVERRDASPLKHKGEGGPPLSLVERLEHTETSRQQAMTSLHSHSMASSTRACMAPTAAVSAGGPPSS